MLKPEQVPDDVFVAFQNAWADPSTLSTKECLAAALNAWPGMSAKQADEHVALFNSQPALILPLTEKQDDQAR